jgi:hypothetical protein
VGHCLDIFEEKLHLWIWVFGVLDGGVNKRSGLLSVDNGTNSTLIFHIFLPSSCRLPYYLSIPLRTVLSQLSASSFQSHLRFICFSRKSPPQPSKMSSIHPPRSSTCRRIHHPLLQQPSLHIASSLKQAYQYIDDNFLFESAMSYCCPEWIQLANPFFLHDDYCIRRRRYPMHHPSPSLHEELSA